MQWRLMLARATDSLFQTCRFDEDAGQRHWTALFKLFEETLANA